MTKSLAAIVVIGLAGLGLFAVAGYLLTENNPRLRLKLALEREAPVKVERVETAIDPASRRITLRLRVAPRGETLTASREAALASRAAAIIAAAPTDMPRLEYDAIEVAPAGEPAHDWDRYQLERRARLEAELAAAAPALAARWGAPARLEPTEEPSPFAGVGPEPGVDVVARPPGDRPDATIAADVFELAPHAAFVAIEAPPGDARPRAVVRRPPGRRR
jgi:hypothetical protein